MRREVERDSRCSASRCVRQESICQWHAAELSGVALSALFSIYIASQDQVVDYAHDPAHCVGQLIVRIAGVGKVDASAIAQ